MNLGNQLAMILINKHTKLSKHMALMPHQANYAHRFKQRKFLLYVVIVVHFFKRPQHLLNVSGKAIRFRNRIKKYQYMSTYKSSYTRCYG